MLHSLTSAYLSGSNSVVESRLPKPLVAGSIPVSRSINIYNARTYGSTQNRRGEICEQNWDKNYRRRAHGTFSVACLTKIMRSSSSTIRRTDSSTD